MPQALHKTKVVFDTVTRTLASLKLAVCLVAAWAAVSAVAKIMEASHGRQYSLWFVYHSAWFIGLLAMLAASVFSAAYVRYPWKRHQTGFVITHAGLLALLAGSMLTYLGGVEGQVALVEGASTDQLTLTARSQITAHWVDRPRDRPYVFTFDGGPVDWQPGTSLDMGDVDGLNARVLRYYQRAEPVENWAADTANRGGPLVRFHLEDKEHGGRVELFLVDADYGAEIFVGPIAARLQTAASDAMLADFLHPTETELGEKGLLTAYYENRVHHFPVDQHVGQAVSVGQSGAKVELVQYLPSAKLDATGKFQPIGDGLRNPLVELKVNLPGDDEPFRQVAFAKSPLLNFDGVYNRDCPVKFVYRHPQITSATAVEFMRDENAKLFGRITEHGRARSLGEITVGSQFELPGGFQFGVVEYLPHARRELSFRRVDRPADNKQPPNAAAAKVEFSIANKTTSVWLQRNHPEFESGTFDLPDGPMRAHFTAAQSPLGFSLELVSAQRTTNHGSPKNAGDSSVVRVKDHHRHFDAEQAISPTEPLTYRGWMFYPTDVREAGHGKKTSIFSAAYDPGRSLKYLGTITVCLGIATILSMRAYF